MDSSGPPTWLTQEKKFLPKKFLIFQKKKYFLTKKFFAPVWKNKSPVPPNFFLYLPETNLFFPKKSFSHPTRKNNFPPKIFFNNYQKKQFSTKISYTSTLNLKHFILDVLWVPLSYFLCQQTSYFALYAAKELLYPTMFLIFWVLYQLYFISFASTLFFF